MTRDEMIVKVSEMVDADRFAHSMGVAEMAVKLAQKYGADEKKAEIAGILHDCAKNLPKDESIRLCEEAGIVLDPICYIEKGLVHAYAGAHLVKTVFGVDDDEIYDAIYFHTTGHADMPLLTKIIYIADMIEPGRTILGVEQMRELAFVDIDEALMNMMDATVRHILKKRCMLHADTIAARNHLISVKKQK